MPLAVSKYFTLRQGFRKHIRPLPEGIVMDSVGHTFFQLVRSKDVVPAGDGTRSLMVARRRHFPLEYPAGSYIAWTDGRILSGSVTYVVRVQAN